MKLELLICNQREYLTNYLKKKFPNSRHDDIEDCVQNTLIKAVRYKESWKRNSSLKTWLTKIASNMYYDSFRATYNKHEYLLKSNEDTFVFDKASDEDFSENYCNDIYLTKLSNELISHFIDNVHVDAFKMNVVDEIDYKDIAIKQNIPIGTVKSRVFRGKKLLQEKYREISYKYEI